MRAAFERHYASLVKLCLALCGRQDVAEDLVQEAFVRTATRIDRLDADEVGPYLRRAVVNLWKNRLRRLAVELRHAPHGDGGPAGLEPLEDRDRVWRAIRRLPPRQRACVVLRYYEDLTEREVGDLLGVSIGTVKSQTSRALDKLREELGHED